MFTFKYVLLVLFFGGTPWFVDAVLLRAELAGSKLPSPRGWVSVSFDGLDTAFLIGGDGESSVERDVWRYSLSLDTLALQGILPEPEGLYYAFAGRDGKGNHFITGGMTDMTRMYRFNGSSAIEWVSTVPDNVASDPYLSFQQPGETDLLYMIPSVGTGQPALTVFNTTELRVTREVSIPVPIGYDYAAVDGAVYVPDGHYILVFLELLPIAIGPPRTDLVAKFDIAQDTVKLEEYTELPERWHNVVYPFVDEEEGSLFLFSNWGNHPNQTLGLYRVELGGNETAEFHEIVVFEDPSPLKYTNVLHVASMNRLYIFGGYESEAESYKDEIWYVDLSPIINRPA